MKKRHVLFRESLLNGRLKIAQDSNVSVFLPLVHLIYKKREWQFLAIEQNEINTFRSLDLLSKSLMQ